MSKSKHTDPVSIRPDPDALLASIKRSEEATRRGRLKIFFGMAAGVGKTYAMLEAARALKSKGIDVVIGLVETHGRQETEALLEGLPLLPRTPVPYRGMNMQELDLDGILHRRPAYVLVDELAHTNTEGMRHAKRYQDVAEIIDNGINVFTTLNVQHIESLVDTVQQITGITVRETVPDSVVDAAYEIELVDIAPDELLQRFAEGKVYTPDRSSAAIEHFFKRENLTALREIALRATAQHVDSQLKDYMQEHRISGPWKTAERLMVAIGSSPHSEKLIRSTRRIASTMEAPWIAVSVQTTRPLTIEAEKRLKKNITLAQELGAELITTTDDDIVSALVRVAQQNNVTQIVVGKSMTGLFDNLVHGGSLVNRLIRESGRIDIYVVQGDAAARRSRQPTLPGVRSPLYHYAVAAAAVFLTTIACQLISAAVDYRSIGMIMLFGIVVLSLFVGKGPVYLSAVLSATIWDFFFIPPRFTFSISQPSDILHFLLFFSIALATGALTSRARAQRVAVRQREQQTSALNVLISDLSSAETVDDIARTGVGRIGAEFGGEVAFYPAESGADLAREPHRSSSLKPDSEKEWTVAEWVFKNRKPAGRGTETLPFSGATYYPLISQGNCLGVMGIALPPGRIMSFDKSGQLQVWLHQLALALERLHLRSDRFGKTLLRSASHELRTPISVITSASSALSDPQTFANGPVRNTLISDIRLAAGRLNRLVENFLNMTRIESGALTIHREWCDIRDLFNAVCTRLRNELLKHNVVVRVQEDMPLAQLDTAIIEQAIANILINAAQYTPENTTITLSASFEQQEIVLSIEDEGPGFPEESLSHIFEKFYRIPGTKAGGTGLGLSIVKGFVEFHGGTVRAENRDGGGARFDIRLPAPRQSFSSGEAE
ncbi:MAG: sensor histidine kinase KdpD [Chitinispirillaceae bacterium]|jgi:two-component system sensor histidine kinase KdpD